MKEHQIPNEEFEQIERFLSEDMPEEEYQAFALKLEQDPALSERVRQTQLLLLGIKEHALAGQLDSFHASSGHSQGRVRKMLNAKYLWAAASLVFIVVLSVVWLNREGKYEKIFSAYFEPDPGLMTTMSAVDNYTFDRAMVDYKSGKYEEAIQRWESLSGTWPASDTLNYFIGSAWLAQQQTGKAIPYLQKVASNGQSVFLKEACWYLGLALAREGRAEEATGFLERSDRKEKTAIIQRLQ